MQTVEIITNVRTAIRRQSTHNGIFTAIKNKERIFYIPGNLLGDSHEYLVVSSQFPWETNIIAILYFADEECKRLNDLVELVT